jgi:hypothetical protein
MAEVGSTSVTYRQLASICGLRQSGTMSSLRQIRFGAGGARVSWADDARCSRGQGCWMTTVLYVVQRYNQAIRTRRLSPTAWERISMGRLGCPSPTAMLDGCKPLLWLWPISFSLPLCSLITSL